MKKFNKHELATVLASLRSFQRRVNDMDSNDIKQMYPDHFAGAEPLSAEEVDRLCERLNTNGADTNEALLQNIHLNTHGKCVTLEQANHKLSMIYQMTKKVSAE